MLIAVDIGNTSISIGVFDGDRLVFKSKMSAAVSRSADEYAALLLGIFEKNKTNISSVDSAIMLSVVPSLTHTVLQMLGSFGIKPLVVGAGIKTGLNIKTEMPGILGADIVAETVAAMKITDTPLIVADLGTATTLTVINAKSELCGCIIAPGVKISLDALAEKCALLADIPLSEPKSLLGKNTADSINSGVVLGNALMLDGFIDKIREEYGFDEMVNVIATGGLAELIVPLCKNKIHLEPNLTLNGLNCLYKINRKKRY
ncbi:MAG: type III pantothenate kinase [Faecalibacterium sp.]|nr:type III pantothenate kinase [Ruminococcus sp.]MCM1391457.1 type III pantothenate kinase [Ruminococcus sp.]MCM1485228.1 type III pantothenate kinase [Faecalibacterium sp.]